MGNRSRCVVAIGGRGRAHQSSASVGEAGEEKKKKEKKRSEKKKKRPAAKKPPKKKKNPARINKKKKKKKTERTQSPPDQQTSNSQKKLQIPTHKTNPCMHETRSQIPKRESPRGNRLFKRWSRPAVDIQQGHFCTKPQPNDQCIKQQASQVPAPNPHHNQALIQPIIQQRREGIHRNHKNDSNAKLNRFE
jgi:hypothetical protein